MELELGMVEALRMAEQGLDRGELPIGAAIPVGGEVVARGHTLEHAERRFLVHAELLALLDYDSLRMSLKERRAATLFTTLEPCLMCLGATMSAFVGSIKFALASPTDGATTEIASIWRADRGFEAARLPAIQGGMGESQARTLFERYVRKGVDGPLRRWALTLIRA